MIEKDLKWLKDLNEKSWVHHPPQYSGGRKTSYGHSEDKPISKEDRKKFWNLMDFYKEQLVFEPGSGVFGFGVSMAVGFPKPATYPGLSDEVEFFITVTSKQMFPTVEEEKANAYETFGKYTHTDYNKKMRELAGLKEPLRPWSHYDY